MALQYRPEIDGLRAVAVVPVILFHAGFSRFSGGFTGVDVFFAISGYLITSILIKELEAGTFSFAGFYERRARRILPALFLVMLCCIPFAWMWLLPSELENFALDAVSVVVFASNIVFAQQTGYFESASELKPLLHTWSLSVEEQFYIIFPISFLLIWRLGRRSAALSLSAAALLSFLLSQFAAGDDPAFNFYWSVTRAWELMAGALCALPTIRPHKARDEALSAIGLALIVTGIFWFDRSDPFPSVNALPPVGGACLIILFGNRATLTARFLSLRPIVGIGLISYSAYLWHQPLFAFARIYSITEPPGGLMAGLALAVFPLAWLTWRYVETPFRSSGKFATISRPRLIQTSAAAAFALAGFGAAGYFTAGFPSRLSDDLLKIADGARDIGKYRNECLYGPTLQDDFIWRNCALGVKRERVDFVLFGDSYAGALADGLDELAKERRQSGLVMGLHACPPIVAIGGTWTKTKAKCPLFQYNMINIVETLRPKKVVLFSAWSQLESREFIAAYTGSQSDGYAAFKQPLVDTLHRIHELGAEVYIICCSPRPRLNLPVPESLARIPLVGSTLDLRMKRADLNLRYSAALSLFQDRDVTNLSKIIDITDVFCDEETCELLHEGRPVLFDKAHLSRFGALLLKPKLTPIMRDGGSD